MFKEAFFKFFLVFLHMEFIKCYWETRMNIIFLQQKSQHQQVLCQNQVFSQMGVLWMATY